MTSRTTTEIDRILLGHKAIMGTTWPVESVVTRESNPLRSRPEWIVAHRLCNGAAQENTRHTTRREALESLRADGEIDDAAVVTIHKETGHDLEETTGLSVRLLSNRELDQLPPAVARRWDHVQAWDSADDVQSQRRLAISRETETTNGGYYCLVLLG